MKKKRRNPARRREALIAIVFILPLLVGVTMFLFIPMIQAFYFSLTSWTGIGTGYDFIGFDNFKKLLTDNSFVTELINTLKLVVFAAPIGILLSVIVANLLNQKIGGRGAYRLIYYLPNVTMSAVVVLVWRLLLNSRVGLVNVALNSLFGINPSWLTDTNLTMISVIFVIIWSGCGYNIIILLAGLQGISPQYYEACRIDGGGGYTCFRHVTIPLVSPTLFFLLVTGIIKMFNEFNIPYLFAVASAGGSSGSSSPIYESLRTLVMGIYTSGMINFQMGYACAKSVVLFVLVITVTIIQFVVQRKWVHY